MHRVTGASATVGASSGNEVVVRARGVYGRHVRLFERDGHYHLDLFKGIETVQVNGRDFFGGAIAAGDRITLGEATITVVDVVPAARPAPEGEEPSGDTLSPVGIPGPPMTPGVITIPVTEVEYRSLRQTAYRICRASGSPEDLATELSDFLDRELPPSEWAVGEFSAAAGFRPLASTFRENPMLPPRMVQDLRSGERLSRAETVTGTLTLIVEPPTETGCAGILVRESPRLAARAVLFLEELVQIAGLAFAGMGQRSAEGSGRGDGDSGRESASVRSSAEAAPPAPAPESTPAETVLRQTDDLKKIVETVEREVIDRAMRRVEGNQSRAAQVLNISRGSLIAKLKEFAIPDYRYLRRERGRRS
ncbi:MAG TPA: helix-turn-helix domain-containing protein [Thermoanaerobaculia bacterium]